VSRIVQGWAEEIKAPIPSAAPATLFPGLRDALVTVAPTEDESIMGDSGLYKLALVSGIAKLVKARRLLEIGTASGFMARHLVLNCGSDSRLWTIDLPPDAISGTQFLLQQIDRDVVHGNTRHHDAAGWYADWSPQREQIVQVFSDSAAFDFSGVELPLDFAYIDGAHSYEYALIDSINVLTRMRASGVVVWDDYYHFFPGVIRAIGQVSSIVPVTRVTGTGLAVGVLPSDWCTTTQHSRVEALRRHLPAPRYQSARP
jgi:predicted O-methyltransferase YrrM